MVAGGFDGLDTGEELAREGLYFLLLGGLGLGGVAGEHHGSHGEHALGLHGQRSGLLFGSEDGVHLHDLLVTFLSHGEEAGDEAAVDEFSAGREFGGVDGDDRVSAAGGSQGRTLGGGEGMRGALALQQADDAGGFLGLGDDEGVVVDIEDADVFLVLGGILSGGGEVADGLPEFIAERRDQFLGFPALGGASAQARHVLSRGMRGQLGAVMAGSDDQSAGEGAFFAER